MINSDLLDIGWDFIQYSSMFKRIYVQMFLWYDTEKIRRIDGIYCLKKFLFNHVSLTTWWKKRMLD